MRILGYIDHSYIKITVFKHAGKILAQFEDGMCQLTYKFREEGSINNLDKIKKILATDFMHTIEQQLHDLQKSRSAILSNQQLHEEEEFDVII